MLNRITSNVRKITEKRPVIVQDEYIQWISFANAGMLHPGNVHCFDYVIQHLPSSHPIIEIGSFCGLSTNVINYFLNKHGKTNKFITADKWIFESADSENTIGNGISHKEYREFVKDTYKRNVQLFSRENLPYTIEEFSDAFFDLWAKKATVKDVFDRQIALGGPVCFVYIDGNHSYEYAKRDFENTARILEKGGFVLFDDSSWQSPFGCAQLMKEIMLNNEFRLVMKNPNYLFQKC